MKQLEIELHDADCKLEEDKLKHCHAVKCFMQQTDGMKRENYQLTSELKKKDHYICNLKSELNKLKDA